MNGSNKTVRYVVDTLAGSSIDLVWSEIIDNHPALDMEVIDMFGDSTSVAFTSDSWECFVSQVRAMDKRYKDSWKKRKNEVYGKLAQS